MFKRPVRFQLIYLFLILFFIFFNIKSQFPILFNYARLFKHYHAQPIGGDFIPLTRYLKGVHWAGYMTCVRSSQPMLDVGVMGPYQQAQFVLSPTLLDLFHPLDHNTIVFECPDPFYRSLIQKKLSKYTVLMNFESGSLLYRKNDLK